MFRKRPFFIRRRVWSLLISLVHRFPRQVFLIATYYTNYYKKRGTWKLSGNLYFTSPIFWFLVNRFCLYVWYVFECSNFLSLVCRVWIKKNLSCFYLYLFEIVCDCISFVTLCLLYLKSHYLYKCGVIYL